MSTGGAFDAKQGDMTWLPNKDLLDFQLQNWPPLACRCCRLVWLWSWGLETCPLGVVKLSSDCFISERQFRFIKIICKSSKLYVELYIYIPGQSLSRIIFDLCGFSGAGLKITFGLRVMDSMTQFWCQKVGLSRLFCVILRHIFGPSKCDWQRSNSAIVRFLVAHYFSVQTKKMQLLDVQVDI